MSYQEIVLWIRMLAPGIMLVPIVVVLVHRLRPSLVDRAIKRERRKLKRQEVQAKVNVLLLLEKTALMRREDHD
jgi:hypothetical protein